MRKVFITGASSKIGLEICKYFLNSGYSILAQYYSENQCLLRLAIDHPGLVELTMVDFSDIEVANKELLNLNLEDCDIFIGGAAIMESSEFGEVSLSNIQKHFNVNLISNIIITQILIKSMTIKKWGRILYLGSIGTKFGGGVNSYSYSLSKHALEFFPSCAKEWAKNNILINTLQVGVTDTGVHQKDPTKNLEERVSLIPINRIAKPSEIASFAYYLASEENSYITLQTLAISGGE